MGFQSIPVLQLFETRLRINPKKLPRTTSAANAVVVSGVHMYAKNLARTTCSGTRRLGVYASIGWLWLVIDAGSMKRNCSQVLRDLGILAVRSESEAGLTFFGFRTKMTDRTSYLLSGEPIDGKTRIQETGK